MSATIDTATARSRESGFGALLREALKADSLLLGLVALYGVLFLVLVHPHVGTTPNRFLFMMAAFLGTGIPFLLAGLFFQRLYHIMRYVKPAHPIAALYGDMKGFLIDPVRAANGLPMVLALFPFMFLFTEIKASIPVLVPFSWDLTFDAWDRALHFGYRPWELMQPVLGYWPITFLVNFNYNFWFFTMWIMWVFFAFTTRPDELRTRFFFTFMVTWALGGSLLAIVFSSAGPCYLTRIGISPDPYEPLMSYLRSVQQIVPVWALDVQDRLWAGHLGKGTIDGISAMPSMHNATSLLFAIAAFKVNRTMGIIVALHAFLIFIGSVHLGWHYAVDAYLAWALTIAIWLVSAPIARWWHRQAAVKHYNALLAERSAA